VAARDKDESALFFARIFGLPYEKSGSHFAPVRVNDTLTGSPRNNLAANV
jgi:hypothetical protein